MGLPRPFQHLRASQHRDGLQTDGAGPGMVLHQPYLHYYHVYVRIRRSGGNLDGRRAAGGVLPERHPYVELLQRLLRSEQQRAGGQCRHIRQGLLPTTYHSSGGYDVVAGNIWYPAASADRGVCILRRHRGSTLPPLGAGDVPSISAAAGADGYVVGYDHLFDDGEIPRPQHAGRLRHELADVCDAYHLSDEHRGQQELWVGAETQPAERCV